MENIWTCKDGKKIPVEEMENDHLIKAYKMMDRKGFIEDTTFNAYYNANTKDMGDGAQLEFEEEAKIIFTKYPSKIMTTLKKEIEKRCLVIE